MTGLTINLSGKRMGIRLSDGAEGVAALCRDFMRGFLSSGAPPRARISIRRSNAPTDHIPGWPEPKDTLLEKRLPDHEVLAWVRETNLFQGRFPLSDRTICSYCLGALHLFDPLTGAGHAFLLERGPGLFRPFHRLLWMYFAQGLGEEGGCFLHGAALEKMGSGYLFLGDSGAGKSTLAGLFTDGAILSDDSPILRSNGGGYWLFPSPFHQRWGENGCRRESMPPPVPIVGLFFLVKGDEVHLEAISRREALSLIISRHIHFFQYLSGEARLLLFDLLHEVSRLVPTYYLHFSRHGDVWPVLSEVRGGGTK